MEPADDRSKGGVDVVIVGVRVDGFVDPAGKADGVEQIPAKTLLDILRLPFIDDQLPVSRDLVSGDRGYRAFDVSEVLFFDSHRVLQRVTGLGMPLCLFPRSVEGNPASVEKSARMILSVLWRIGEFAVCRLGDPCPTTATACELVNGMSSR